LNRYFLPDSDRDAPAGGSVRSSLLKGKQARIDRHWIYSSTEQAKSLHARSGMASMPASNRYLNSIDRISFFNDNEKTVNRDNSFVGALPTGSRPDVLIGGLPGGHIELLE
jgi:hypothetical protein